MSRLSRILRSDERDRGTSLMEVIITMIIFSIVIAATLTITIGFTRTTAQTMSRQDQIDDARVSVERMSTTLRTAVMPSQLSCSGCTVDAFIAGQDYSARFYANFQNQANSVGPSKISYVVNATSATLGTLVETVQIPDSPKPGASGYVYCDATAPGATADCKARLKTRTLATDVVLPGKAPLLSYFDKDGKPLVPAASGGSLTADNLGDVFGIELSVTTQKQSGNKAKPTTYIQRITLPNAQALLYQEDDTP